jgi:hypothetical protein
MDRCCGGTVRPGGSGVRALRRGAMDSVEAVTTPVFVRLLHGFVRVGRFLVFLGTAGWVFPHVCTEGMDLTRIQKEQSAGQG